MSQLATVENRSTKALVDLEPRYVLEASELQAVNIVRQQRQSAGGDLLTLLETIAFLTGTSQL